MFYKIKTIDWYAFDFHKNILNIYWCVFNSAQEFKKMCNCLYITSKLF